MKWMICELRIWNQVKLWSSQLWEQFLQLRREAWKFQDFNGVWTRDLTIPVRRSNQLRYEATDVGSWSFVGSNGPVRNESVMKWYMKWMIHFIYHFIIDSFLTGPLEPTNDQLPTSVASYLSWLERRTGIARSRVQTPLKSWNFQASLRNCKNCSHNCEDHSFTWFVEIVETGSSLHNLHICAPLLSFKPVYWVQNFLMHLRLHYYFFEGDRVLLSYLWR